ncbi:hypothetical protein cypCar_00044477 [Cyprinus carpio]|nr:hypothetical protein cypCar_00044477 [Cyprinus carpio]
MEGDSVTLNIDDTQIREDDYILWTFGAEKSIIAQIIREFEIFYTYNGTDGRFRDRLKLDQQTLSLTITNTTSEHAGDYKLEIHRAKLPSKTFSVSVYEVHISCCDTVEAVIRLVVTALMGVAAAAAAVLLVNDVRSDRG